MTEQHYSIDFGGSGARIAAIDPTDGTLTADTKIIPMRVILSDTDLVRNILSIIPQRSNVGIGAAGLIDKKRLVISDSPNSSVKTLTFPNALAERGDNVTLGNDLEVAVEGYAKYHTRDSGVVVAVATFSSGFNANAAHQGIVFTNHELGHVSYKPGSGVFCGCGGVDHLEPWVTGTGAAAMARDYFSKTRRTAHKILDLALQELSSQDKKPYRPDEMARDPALVARVLQTMTAQHVYATFKASQHDSPQREIWMEQTQAIAFALGLIASTCRHPDGGNVKILGLMGSMTKDWDILFAPAIQMYNHDPGRYQQPKLERPDIVKCPPDIGLQGAMAYWVNHHS